MDVLQYSRRSGFLYIDTPLTRAACKKYNWASYFYSEDDGDYRWNIVRRAQAEVDKFEEPLFLYANWFMISRLLENGQRQYAPASDRNAYLIRNLHVSINCNFNPEPRSKVIDLYDCRFDLVIVPMPPGLTPKTSQEDFNNEAKVILGKKAPFSIKNFNLASRRRNRIRNTFSLDFSHKDVFILYPYDTICLFCHIDANVSYPITCFIQYRVTFDYVIV